MTWTKLSDDWSDDTWTMSDGAYRLHSDGLVWSNRKLLDLDIPKDDLPRLSRRPECIQELLDGGWWTDTGACYRIVHHAAYQRTRAQVIKQQEAAKANGKLGGRPGKPSGLPSLDSEQVSQIESELVSITGLVTQSPSKSESERDRTGLASRSSRSELGLAGTGKRATKIAAVPASPSMPACYECNRRRAFPNWTPCPEHQTQETA